MLKFFKLELYEFTSDITGTSCGRKFREQVSGLPLPEKLRLLAEFTGEDETELSRAFGRRAIARMIRFYPDFVGETVSFHDYLLIMEKVISDNLNEFFPNASPVLFSCEALSGGDLRFYYRSCEPAPEFCYGLLAGLAEHFGETVKITRGDHPDADAIFDIEIISAAAHDCNNAGSCPISSVHS